jgi:hypothetical protein
MAARPAEGGGVRCQNLLDVVPAASLDDGSYAFEVRFRLGDGSVRARQARFAKDRGL